MQPTIVLQRANFTAVVSAVDGVRFTASAECPEHLMSKVVDYVSGRCDNVLWPATARQVHALIRDGQSYAAVALYFGEVGDRWDDERLELGGLSLSPPQPAMHVFAEAS